NASVFAQGCADFSSDSSDRNHSFTPDPRRASPSLRPCLSFRYTQLSGEANRENNSAHSLPVHVFTQPRPSADIQQYFGFWTNRQRITAKWFVHRRVNRTIAVSPSGSD